MTQLTNDVGADAVRLIIADDHTLFRDGLTQLLAAAGFAVIADADNGDTALSLIVEHKPTIALLDVQMQGPGPVSLMEQIKLQSPSTRVIFLSMHEPPQLVRELESRGMSGYLRKTIDREVLMATVKAVALGMVMRPGTSQQIETGSALTSLELELLQLVARSYSNRKIAQTMYISESTVKRHLTNAYHKLGATTRVEALSRAFQNGLISNSE